MLSLPSRVNSIGRRGCDLSALQRQSPLQANQERSKNETEQSKEKRFSTLNLAKKLSNLLSVIAGDAKSILNEGDNSEQPKESSYEIHVELKPNKGQHIYRPGQCVQGQFKVDGQAHRLASFKRITIRVHGMIIFSRLEKDDSKRSGRSIGRKKWLFYDSKAMTYTKDELKKLGIESMPVPGDGSQKHSLEMPFAFELPMRCISYQHAFRFVREPAPLPPTMHFEVEEKDENGNQEGDEEAIVDPVVQNRRNGSIRRTWNTVKNKLGGNRTLQATIRYMLTVTVEWQESFLRLHVARCNLPFIVQPSPPASTTFIHSITNRRSRQLLHLPAERTNADFLGNAFQEIGESNEIGDLLNSSRSRRPSITVDRQISESSFESVSTWVDLMLKDTERGPQAWVFYHFYKRIATDQLIEVVFSHPATAALVMDTQIPFNVTVSDPRFAIEFDSISFNLLRTIRCISPGGELRLESRAAQKGGKNGDVSVVQITKSKPISRYESTPPPADEYSGQDFFSCFASRNGIQGQMIINSGFEANDESMEKSNCITFSSNREQDWQRSKLHPCFLSSNKEQIMIPSFNFRGLCVEYNLELQFNLVQRFGNQDGNTIPVSFLTPMVKLASQTQNRPTTTAQNRQRRVRSILGLSPVAPDEQTTTVNADSRRYPVRHSSLVLESLITRQSSTRTQRPPEWNVNRSLPSSPPPQFVESFVRQYPPRPPFRRTNQNDEITEELVRSSTTSSSTRHTSNGEHSAEYTEILSIPSQRACLSSSNSHSSADENSSCLENGPETSMTDFASCLEPDTPSTYQEADQEARQAILHVPHSNVTRSNSPLRTEDLSEVIDRIEEVTNVERSSDGHPRYLDAIPNSINPRTSLISMRTIDGPAPPYIGSLQDS